MQWRLATKVTMSSNECQNIASAMVNNFDASGFADEDGVVVVVGQQLRRVRHHAAPDAHSHRVAREPSDHQNESHVSHKTIRTSCT